MNHWTINNVYGYDKSYKYLDKVIKDTLKKLNIKKSLFSIIFISDEEMHELNNSYRKIDRTTDVLSFAFEDNELIKNNKIRVLGDIYISIPKMKAQAEEYGHGEQRELSFLTIHGLLHLLGYDHMTKEDETIMFGLQEEILDGKKV